MIKEPKDVDFVVDPRPLTKDEEKLVSDYFLKRKKVQIEKELMKSSLKKKKI